MNTNDEVPRDDLRKRAEAALADVGRDKPPAHPDDIKALIHDLRVHQIELEMQNEELRVSRTSLEVARDKYARLYNQSPVGYISVDKHGIVRKANQTFLDMIDHGTADIRDKPLVDYLSAESRDVFLGRFGAFFRQPMGKTMDIELRGATGRVVVRLSARRVPDDEELLVAVVDIGEQAKAEARVNALLEEKQMLLREVHHRIKNNMNVAMAMLAIQADTIENPEAKTAMEDAGRRMFSMMVIYEKLYRSE
ncbi:MAG: PAS domain S-box protein, partial [Spirochaetales bacterium]|nr:PAS domain S-box protein [Spirochaetales bacterium]